MRRVSRSSLLVVVTVVLLVVAVRTGPSSEGGPAPTGEVTLTVTPTVLVAGESTPVFVRVVPASGAADGEIAYVVGTASGTLGPRGGAWSGIVTVTTDEDVELQVTITQVGGELRLTEQLAVSEGGLPTSPAPAPEAELTLPTPDGELVRADRVVVRMEPGATPAQITGAADAVNGEVIGRLGGLVWQVEILPAPGFAILEAVLEVLASQDGVASATAIPVGPAPETEVPPQPDGEPVAPTEVAISWGARSAEVREAAPCVRPGAVGARRATLRHGSPSRMPVAV